MNKMNTKKLPVSLGAVLTFLIFSCVTPDPLAKYDSGIQKDLKPVKTVYQNDFTVGAAVEPEQLEGAEAALLRFHFNSLTPENAMKFKSIHPEQDAYAFERADRIVEFAKTYGMKVRGHTFVWHHPDEIAQWVFSDATGGKRSRKEVLEILSGHMETLMKRYGDIVYAWDVVNEAIDPAEKDGIRRTEWYEAIGPDYVAEAFRTARRIDPKAVLIYNDYGFFDPIKGEFLYKFIKGLKDAGVPIDGIGMQEHLTVTYPKIEAMRDTLRKFRELGLQIHITELDMSLYTHEFEQLSTPPEDYLVHQAHRYKALFQLYRENRDLVRNVTFWGYHDGHTWLTEGPNNRPDWPLLFTAEFKAKLAYTGVVQGELPEDKELAVVLPPRVYRAVRGTPEIDGEPDGIWAKAAAVKTDKSGMPVPGAIADVRVLWDDEYLYVLADVTDPVLSEKGTQRHEQDSFEVFLDENNGKTAAFEADDFQFRVGFSNRKSVGGKAKDEMFTSAAVKTGTGYRIETAFKFQTVKPVAGMKMGLDFQVNDSADKTRIGIMKWNDPTNESWRNTSGWGTLELTE